MSGEVTEQQQNVTETKYTFKDDMWDGFELACKKVEAGRRLCEQLVGIVNDKAQLELHNATTMEKMAKDWLTMSTTSYEGSTVRKAVGAIRMELLKNAEQAREFATAMQEDVVTQLSATIKNHGNVLRRIHTDGMKTIKHLSVHSISVETSKKNYVKCCQEALACSTLSLHHIGSPALRTKNSLRALHLCRDAQIAEEQYIHSVKMYNNAREIYNQQIGTIFDALQDMDTKRIKCFQDSCMKIQIYATSLLRNRQYDLDATISAIEGINSLSEMNQFINTNRSSTAPPNNITIEPLSALLAAMEDSSNEKKESLNPLSLLQTTSINQASGGSGNVIGSSGIGLGSNPLKIDEKTKNRITSTITDTIQAVSSATSISNEILSAVNIPSWFGVSGLSQNDNKTSSNKQSTSNVIVTEDTGASKSNTNANTVNVTEYSALSNPIQSGSDQVAVVNHPDVALHSPTPVKNILKNPSFPADIANATTSENLSSATANSPPLIDTKENNDRVSSSFAPSSSMSLYLNEEVMNQMRGIVNALWNDESLPVSISLDKLFVNASHRWCACIALNEKKLNKDLILPSKAALREVSLLTKAILTSSTNDRDTWTGRAILVLSQQICARKNPVKSQLGESTDSIPIPETQEENTMEKKNQIESFKKEEETKQADLLNLSAEDNLDTTKSSQRRVSELASSETLQFKYLSELLYDHEIWNNVSFWEGALQIAISEEMLRVLHNRRWSGLSNLESRKDNSASTSLSSKYSADVIEEEERKLKYNDPAIGTLMTFAHSMVVFGVKSADVRNLVMRVCRGLNLGIDFAEKLLACLGHE